MAGSMGSVTRLEKAPKGRCRKWKLRYKVDGKDRTRRFEGTYSQAKEALARFRAELELAPDPAGATFEEYAAEWLSRRASSGEYAANTLRSDASDVRALSARFGGMRLSEMTRPAVAAGMEAVKAGVSGATAAKRHSTLKCILREAVYDGIIDSNPADLVRPPRIDTAPKKPLTVAQCVAVGERMRALPSSPHVVGAALMLFAGLRRSEAVGLDWRHVEEGRVRVEQQGTQGGGAAATKTRSGVRAVPLVPLLSDLLEEWRAAQRVILAAKGVEQDGSTPVVTNARGGRMNPSALYEWWRANSAGLFGVECTPHELRHTFLTLLANSGASMQSVKSIAGWADISMANVYVHPDEEADAEAVRMLDARMCRHTPGA